jgi:predicted Zn-dependent peptidase
VSELHAFNVNGFTVDEIQSFKSKLTTLTRQEVNSVIKKYFNPKFFTISGAGPVNSVKSDLQTFAITLNAKAK